MKVKSSPQDLIERYITVKLKITYWDVVDAAQIRMLDGSLDGEVNSLAIFK
jgi:hypothetical protein